METTVCVCVCVCVCVRPSHVDAGRWCDGGSRHDRVESRESNHGREHTISTWSYPLDVPISAGTHSTTCEATSVEIHFDVTPAYARSIPAPALPQYIGRGVWQKGFFLFNSFISFTLLFFFIILRMANLQISESARRLSFILAARFLTFHIFWTAALRV